MKLQKKPGLVHAALLFAGLALAVPAVAQQEVSPDHFDDQPKAAQSKPAPHKTAATSAKPATIQASDKAKSKPVVTAVLKAEVAKSQASQNPR